MDDWAFISLAKARADRAVRERDVARPSSPSPLTKTDTATALEHPLVRGGLALVVGVLVNALFFTSVDRTALDARVPGEVVVADIEPAPQDYAAALAKE
jgi:hypothetical protein